MCVCVLGAVGTIPKSKYLIGDFHVYIPFNTYV